jgi:hypothetical protein
MTMNIENCFITSLHVKIDSYELERLFCYLRDNICYGAMTTDDYVLNDYFLNVVVKKRIAAMLKKNDAVFRLKMPISVARIVWDIWQKKFQNHNIQNSINQIDALLLNLNARPEKPLIVQI